jgi:hypothetical protein
MKRILFIIATVAISYCAYAQNTFPTSGNVGIGTITPALWGTPYKVLDMFGYGFIYGSSNGTGFSGTGYGQAGWGNNTYYDGTSHAIGTGAASSLLQGTGYLIFQNAPSVNAGSTQTFTERFRIDNNGNVGIGTTAPDAPLAVNGTIHSKEVKVDLVGWPDYVFKRKYILPSLSEIKTYIDKNQHLPEMPSEQEVAKNGINLGEIIKLQTKKIEELTLYLIEKGNEVKRQEQINQQQAQIQQLQQGQLKTQQEQLNQLKKQLATITKALTKN